MLNCASLEYFMCVGRLTLSRIQISGGAAASVRTAILDLSHITYHLNISVTQLDVINVEVTDGCATLELVSISTL